MPRSVVILGAARTPIGRYGGSFKDVHPAELGAIATRGALARSGVTAADVEDVWMGHGRQAGSGPNPARQVAHRAGVPHSVPAQTINKACASGLQAIASAAQSILLGDADVVLAGGIESMSRMPYLVDSIDARWGHRMGHFQFVDAMYRDGFQCPLSNLIMGETAEILARQYEITRQESDAFALASQHKAEAAQKAGRFADEIVPVTVTERGKSMEIAADEHPRHGSTIEALGKLPLTFPKVEGHDGIITAGSASGITDGGAALVLASAEFAAARGLRSLATITGWASAGVDPRIMGIGPVPAIEKLQRKTGLGAADFDLVELNEAFAAQVLAVLRDVPIAAERLNVNGGAIALGHPIGATGARIVVTLVHELRRRGGGRGLATLCVSGGMGMAMALDVS
ncbi:MAG TPA: acetyl-CoA C-acyltransferase [Vicinamibacterales bacterium]|jgi:acetyl-CoA C-acetyltransferase|nr:acetyl-CoA C-acyltransferase [Vicinamibacterales bacterium]